MKRIVFIAVSLMLINMTQAGIMDGPANPHLGKNNIILGGKLALGNVYDAPVGFVFSGEYGLMGGFLSIPKFPTSLGLGLNIGFSRYTEDFTIGEYDYTNFFIITSANYHVKLIKKIPMDTYAIISFGINFESSNRNFGPGGDAPDRNDGIKFGTGIGARYYFTSKLAAVGELGFGMGFMRIGLDFKLN